MSEIVLKLYTAADHDWLVAQHQQLYAADEGFDHTFGPLVDGILTQFEAAHDPEREAGWIAWQGDDRLGSIFCVSAGGDLAKLRLFLLVPEARGKGLGKRLLRQCMRFAAEKKYRRMTLWTHASHEAACALYAQFGWSIAASKSVRSFGVDLIEQQWEISL